MSKIPNIATAVLAAVSAAFAGWSAISAYGSYRAAVEANQRADEDISITRAGCCGGASIEIEYQDGAPVSLYRDIAMNISNLSTNPLSIVHCHTNSEIPGWLGILGSECDAVFQREDGNIVSPTFTIGGGEVISMKFRLDWTLSDIAIAAYGPFVSSGNTDYVQFLCDHDVEVRGIAFLQPYLLCGVGRSDSQSSRLWITLNTGRGNAFESEDYR